MAAGDFPGPQGTGDKFKNMVKKLTAKGWTELRARRAASQSLKPVRGGAR